MDINEKWTFVLTINYANRVAEQVNLNGLT